MAELSLFWDGSTTGDCGPYADEDIMDTFFRAVLDGTGNRGVLYGWENMLEVTALVPSASASESPSPSISASPSASESPSESPSTSPSASESPSGSPSTSPSSSPSPSSSESPSESASASPSASGSPSMSASISPSSSESASASPSPYIGIFDVKVDTGAAIIYGLYYQSTEVEDFTVAANSTTYIVVRRSWAAFTARLTAVAAVVQNVGVTYDIPLARVVTDGFGITSITDLREYCRYSTDLHAHSIQVTHISPGAITTDKLANQTRWITRGAGELEPDLTNPPLRGFWNGASPWQNPKEDTWFFSDSSTNIVWMTFRVPEDMVGTTIEVFIQLSWIRNMLSRIMGNQYWGVTCYSAAPNGAFVSQSKTAAISEVEGWTGGGSLITYDELVDAWEWGQSQSFSLGTILASAGQTVLCKVSRFGGNALDTSVMYGFLHVVEFKYTADS